MLKLEKIVKIYDPGTNDIVALNGVSIDFRKSEFVSILGPSGCGKTTLLNVIGGLDSYTSGDLFINGKSTKDFKDRDWDNYRNHSIGFVFQSYNLISHQTILRNVELALTLSGIDPKTRKEKAKEALEAVGLKDQMNKKPNQLSGGQMQRVAIARALVNNPSILLADEPTGALDTNTSIQIMNILKKVSEDRLVIMVTHNPDLAETYSTRIIRVLDGIVVDDSNPYHFELSEEKQETEENLSKKEMSDKKKQQRRERKANSMNFFTALSLSFNNMITKKARTILTAFAGSIGIIGIALILSLSSGFKEYINKIERNTLSSYPLTVNRQAVDTSALLSAVTSYDDEIVSEDEKKEDTVYSNNVLGKAVNSISKSYKENNMKSFKEYIESKKEELDELGIVNYGYASVMNIYFEDTTNGASLAYPYSFVEHLTGANAMYKDALSSIDNLYNNMPIWQEILSNNGDYSLVKSQYDVVAGCWPDEVNDGNSKYQNVVIRVDKNDSIPDYVLYALGLDDPNSMAEEIKNYLINKTEIASETKEIAYKDLMNLKFKCVVVTDTYQLTTDKYELMTGDDLKTVINNSLNIRVCGIIKENGNAKATSLTGYVGYMAELNNYIIDKTNSSNIVNDQKKDETINVFTGKAFEGTESLILNYATLGVVDYDDPSSINFYPNSFENKDEIIKIINEYNEQFENEEDKISYTDYVGILMSSISTVINAITYVLIAFVAISLVVSSIMIGIITYISVLERTKEIGILRAIGASKKDISRVFNAETVILGFFSGAMGVLITVLLNIPINIIIKALANIEGVAALPILGAISLVIISVLLTLIAGTIPSRIASKKDPVVALRTE